jgi:transposase InsO family protein
VDRLGTAGHRPLKGEPAIVRPDRLNHIIVFDEKHLRRILTAYFDYYHYVRPHQSLEQNAPG